MKQKKTIIASFLLAIFIIGILFYSSSQTYEKQSIVPFINEQLKNRPFQRQLSGISFLYGGVEVSIRAMGYSKFIEFFLRKMAHFFSYLLLGSFLFIGLRLWLGKSRLSIGIALIIPLIYAFSDECHQYWTRGRTPLLEDVVLDFWGAAAGVIGVSLIWKYKKRKQWRFYFKKKIKRTKK